MQSRVILMLQLVRSKRNLMKKKSEWQPSKYEKVRGRWRSSRQTVGIGSRLNADRIVTAYERAIRDFADGDLIDLGCGNAPLAGIYRDKVERYTWLDWPNSPHREYEVDIHADLNTVLPIEDESYETVILSDVIEHISNPELLFSECTRILKPGGHLLVGVPFLYPLHEEPFDYHRYTIHKLREFGKKYQLSVERIEEYAGGLEVVQDMLTKMLSYSTATRWLAYIINGFLSTALIVPLIGRQNEKIKKKFPLGYVAVYRKLGRR